MASEIERKFLVPETPEPGVLGSGTVIRQGYLAVDRGVEVRLRLTEGAATLTVKAGTGLRRCEVEVSLAAADARELWPHTDGRRVEKTRHPVALGGERVAEVDLYDGSLVGLCTVEVEFPTESAAVAFSPPGWFGQELTGDPGWSNAALSLNGRPPS
ncbi:MAG: CYTH domain-containing protein [Acidimicrobiia bacterium]|nr:CYTH domain-containing protein [Acidimicrobiia bacterium]